MSWFDIEPGRKLLCQELNTGKDHTGFFYLDDKTISAEICSYDEYLYIQPEKPVFLRTENIKSFHYTQMFRRPLMRIPALSIRKCRATNSASSPRRLS